jgi:hypothetical protein
MESKTQYISLIISRYLTGMPIKSYYLKAKLQ